MKAISGKSKAANNFDLHKDKKFDANCLKAVNDSCEVNKKSRIYFAAPWFDCRANKLYDSCVTIYNKLKEENKTEYSVFFPREHFSEYPIEAFNKNVDNVKNCDVLVALVSRKDCGTSWEIGMAYALGKPVYLMGYDESTFLSKTNLMLAFTGKCITISSFGKLLTKELTYKDYVNIENIWEGIE